MSELPVVQQQQDINPYVWMDQQDDEQIIAELTGRMQTYGKHLEKNFFYEFGKGDNAVSGLSKAGVGECVRQLHEQGIHISEVGTPEYRQCPVDSEYVVFMVKCERYKFDQVGNKIVLEQITGTKRQWLYREEIVWERNPRTKKSYPKKDKDGNIIKKKKANEFWFEMGKSKAARNAKFELVPFGIRVEVLEKARAIAKGAVFPAQQRQRQPPRQLPQQQQLPQPKQLPEPERLPDFNDKNWSKNTVVPNRFLAPSMQNQKITFWAMAVDNTTKFTHNNGNQHTLASWLHVANYHGTEWEPVFQKTIELRKWWKGKQAEKEKAEKVEDDTPPWVEAEAEREFVENM